MSDQDNVQRTVLPIPDQPRKGLVLYDAKDPENKYPPITPLRPPAGAPNVLIVLIDDAGFGSSSAFGGPCATPTAELLASEGLKFNRFHTTALCSPTRQALLTGRNHHTVGMGGITEIATGSPGYNSILPNTCAPLARTLKLNGYATAQFGKCHEVPVWETSPAGPFDAWPTGGARINSDLAGRPTLIKGNSQILFGSMGRLSENSVINIKNKSHAVTAEITVPKTGAEGVIIAQGGNIGGWSLYTKGGKLKYCYNLLGIQQFYAESADVLPPGDHQVRMEFAYDGGGLGKGGTASLYVDGKEVGEVKVAATAAMVFSADDGCDVGVDTGSPVSPDYGAHGNEFTGTVKGVQLAIAKDAESLDHLVKPDEAVRIAMARQ
jgi:hypothetical protein